MTRLSPTARALHAHNVARMRDAELEAAFAVMMPSEVRGAFRKGAARRGFALKIVWHRCETVYPGAVPEAEWNDEPTRPMSV